jgi:DNA polymerase elongation subunit (family B)
MSSNTQLTDEQIESFLTGSDPEKYIVAIEPEYNYPRVTLIINEPGFEKKMVVRTYKPFLWFDGKVFQKMYEGNTVKRLEFCQKMGVKIDFLRTHDENGFIPKRMENGYKYLAKCDNSFNDLIMFFKLGGIDVFSTEWSKSFIIFSPIEQYLIQTGKRLFKGFDDYNDLHRLQFDLETEGLNGSKNAIFQIGIKDNKNIEHVFDIKGDTPREKRENERKAIKNFFKVIAICKPDIIAGYNSENFDWPFLFERANKLGIDMSDIAISLDNKTKIKRKPSTLKLGGETEAYTQTHLYGYNILDISHAVRRAMAINSEIKGWGLKYITKYSDIAKPNRVYVSGDKINSTWADKKNQYAFNNETGDWYKITQKKPLIDDYQIVSGEYIVERYLCDDLWETEQIDYIYNQASFLISKIIPTSFMRSSTMGTAGQWKLIMAAWSYQNGLAIPETQPKKKFTGGLSRLLQVGYAKNVVKLDFAALYPKTQLTWDIFPDLDISGVMKGLLTYVVNTRDYYKNLTEVEKKTVKRLTEQLEKNKHVMTEEEISSLKKEISKHKQLKSLYDKKQLPLKILANSWFGSYGAPYIFNWGDTDSAEETTCRGRQ